MLQPWRKANFFFQWRKNYVKTQNSIYNVIVNAQWRWWTLKRKERKERTHIHQEYIWEFSQQWSFEIWAQRVKAMHGSYYWDLNIGACPINLIFPFIMPTPLKGIGFMDCGMIKRMIILPISIMLMGELCRLSFSHTQFINSRTNSLLHSPTFPPWGLHQGNISAGQKGRSPTGRAAGSQGCCLFSAEQRGCAGMRLDNLAHLFTSMKQMSMKPLLGLCGEFSLIKEEGFSFLINYMFTHTHGAFLFFQYTRRNILEEKWACL